MRGQVLRRFLPLAVLLFLAGHSLLGQAVSPNVERGFDPQKAYSYGEVDAIGLFNGNLNVPIPIGMSYPVGGTLSYQLAMHYAGNSWESETADIEISQGQPPETYSWQFPSRRDNAGMGWRLHFGRLLMPGASGCMDASTLAQRWGYEAPDGSVKCFYATLHSGRSEATNSSYWYSRDGSYLRLNVSDPSIPKVEFPDGTIHEFQSTSITTAESGVLGVIKMMDRFNNWVTVDYTPSPSTYAAPEAPLTAADVVAAWRIDDSQGRTHVVYFGRGAAYSEFNPNADVQHAVVAQVRLLGFGGTSSIYKFSYEKVTPSGGGAPTWPLIQRSDLDDLPKHPAEGTYVPATLLQQIVLPDGSTYEFVHDHGDGSGYVSLYQSGALTSLTLPTLGRITWDYEAHTYPSGSILPYTQKTGRRLTTSLAVITRRMYAKNSSTPTSRRDYVYGGASETADPIDIGVVYGPGSGPVEKNVVITEYADEQQSVILSKQKSFFSVCTDHAPLSCLKGYYALPLTTKTHTDVPSDNGYNRWLSSITYGPGSGWTQVLRRTYVSYEADIALASATPGVLDLNRRLYAQDTVYDDDVAGQTAHSTSVVQTDFDGLGHYRQATASSTFGPTRTTVTGYNPSNGTYRAIGADSFSMIPVSSPWLLEMFTHSEATEGDQKLRTEFAFDSSTGFLDQKRTLKNSDGTRSMEDIVTAYTGSGGNVVGESHYGGDQNQLTSTDAGKLTTAQLGTATAQITHEYQYGVRKYSKYTNNVLIADVTPDPAGQIASSRDSAAVGTAFVYDTSGRLTQVKPTGRAWSTYTYQNATASSPAKITVSTYPAGYTSGTTLATAGYDYDDFGRVIREWQTLPADREADAAIPSPVPSVIVDRKTTYDALGRRVSSTELGSTYATTMTYDALSRVQAVTAPDSSVVSFAYSGARTKSRTVSISTSPIAAQTAVTTTEEYDSFGRLARIREKSGPTSSTTRIGAEVVTEYTYDAADRLRNVRMAGAEGVVQNRIFDYDGRGFLQWESQPESAMAFYTYDGRGKVLTKTQSGSTPFDLTYAYDAAERLTSINGRNPDFESGNSGPDYQAFRPLKVFTYATTNLAAIAATGLREARNADLGIGKIRTATRYNYPTAPLERIVRVVETYSYRDPAGRKTDRSTEISSSDSLAGFFSISKTVDQFTDYNDLDLPARVGYPLCTSCGLPPSGRRTVALEYASGRLFNVREYTIGQSTVQQEWAALTYSPSGARHRIFHGNGLYDEIEADPNGLARPKKISTSRYTTCTAPVIVSQPVGGTITSGTTKTLSVTVTGTAPLYYQWYYADTYTPIAGATGTSYVATATQTTSYLVIVSNACNEVESRYAVVTVGACTAPQVTQVDVARLLDGTVSLRASGISGTDPLTYEWRDASNVVVATGQEAIVSLAVAQAGGTFRATNSCGQASQAFSYSTNPVITTLTATASGTQINVSWLPIAGATSYRLERTSAGGVVTAFTVTGTSFPDSGLAAGTYAYRLKDDRVISSNADIATVLLPFTAVATGAHMSGTQYDQLLAGLNAVRALSGWPALTWTTLLSPDAPPPAVSAPIDARQLAGLRARLNEALQAVGVPIASYTDSDPKSMKIRAAHITELQQRFQ